MSNFKTKFGKRLVELRKEKKLSQERLAEFIDIAPRNLSKIETGVTFPSVENLEKIISVLGCKPYLLFEFEHLDESTNLKKEIITGINKLSDEKLTYLYKFYKSIE